ncbi:MAG: hypothetical protein WC455_15150 [Dehalococcoidia bacterium]|jgi:hypothetical protein
MIAYDPTVSTTTDDISYSDLWSSALNVWICADKMAEEILELADIAEAKARMTATGVRSCRAFHDALRPVQNPVLRRRHCRKEILRNHDRQFPAIRAAMRANQ